jgi:hypothetical protein
LEVGRIFPRLACGSAHLSLNFSSLLSADSVSTLEWVDVTLRPPALPYNVSTLSGLATCVVGVCLENIRLSLGQLTVILQNVIDNHKKSEQIPNSLFP